MEEHLDTDIFDKGLHRIKDFEATVTKLLELFDSCVVVYEGLNNNESTFAQQISKLYDEDGRLASVISQLKSLDDDNLKENEGERVMRLLKTCVDSARIYYRATLESFKDRFTIREVIKQRYEKVKTSYEKAKKKNTKISSQKAAQYENMKRTYETFSNELLSDLDVFEEQKLDTFDDAVIALLTFRLHLSTKIDSQQLSDMISKANNCIDMFKRNSSAAAPKAFTLPSPDAFKTVSSFQEFLRHPVAIEYFRKFLVLEHAEENLSFWMEVQSFKKLSNSSEIHSKFFELYGAYVARNAPNEINVSYACKEEIQQKVMSKEFKPDNKVLDRAANEILFLMHSDSYERFFHTNLYTKLKRRLTIKDFLQYGKPDDFDELHEYAIKKREKSKEDSDRFKPRYTDESEITGRRRSKSLDKGDQKKKPPLPESKSSVFPKLFGSKGEESSKIPKRKPPPVTRSQTTPLQSPLQSPDGSRSSSPDLKNSGIPRPKSRIPKITASEDLSANQNNNESLDSFSDYLRVQSPSHFDKRSTMPIQPTQSIQQPNRKKSPTPISPPTSPQIKSPPMSPPTSPGPTPELSRHSSLKKVNSKINEVGSPESNLLKRALSRDNSSTNLARIRSNSSTRTLASRKSQLMKEETLANIIPSSNQLRTSTSASNLQLELQRLENASQTTTSKPKISEPVAVRVALRVRPFIEKEKLKQTPHGIRCLPGENQVVIGKDRKSFVFDWIFPSESFQNQIFESCVEPLLEWFFEGYNATVLAYGQTGSGKTFTMGSGNNSGLSKDKLGIIPRAIDLIFSKANELLETKPNIQFVTKVSFLELYNEEIRDMLSTTQRDLHIHEDSNGIYVSGLTEEVVSSQVEMESTLLRGSENRTVASTLMNEQSSRSHAIFTITLEQIEPIPGSDVVNSIISKFHFVDLAGSERLAKTKAEGAQMKEGISINAGLLALGNVIAALCDKKKKHIPYRDSKLTRLLQDSLGGNSRTVMIACVSPADVNMDETVNTLRYASHARHIENKPIVNVDPIAQELSQLRSQVQLLQEILSKYKKGIDVIKENVLVENTSEDTLPGLETASLDNSRISEESEMKVETLEEENRALRDKIVNPSQIPIIQVDTSPETQRPNRLPKRNKDKDLLADIMQSQFTSELSKSTEDLLTKLSQQDFKIVY